MSSLPSSSTLEFFSLAVEDSILIQLNASIDSVSLIQPKSKSANDDLKYSASFKVPLNCVGGVAERPPSVCVCFGLEEAVCFNWD